MHVSFSSLKDWKSCSYKLKIYKIDGIRSFLGNEHTTFGNAMHDVAEMKLNEKSPESAWEEYFERRFINYITEAKKNGADVKSFDEKLIKEMRAQGKELIPLIVPALKEYFGEYTVIGTEIEIKGEIPNVADISFLGFIDLVVATPDGKVHIVDYKTCSWGWDARRKAEPMVTYQLTLYKYFFAKMAELDPKDIETHFVLLKRVGKKNRVEPFRVTSGPKKTTNALELLTSAATSLSKKFFIKNKTACDRCPFYRTEHCK